MASRVRAMSAVLSSARMSSMSFLLLWSRATPLNVSASNSTSSQSRTSITTDWNGGRASLTGRAAAGAPRPSASSIAEARVWRSSAASAERPYSLKSASVWSLSSLTFLEMLYTRWDESRVERPKMADVRSTPVRRSNMPWVSTRTTAMRSPRMEGGDRKKGRFHIQMPVVVRSAPCLNANALSDVCVECWGSSRAEASSAAAPLPAAGSADEAAAAGDAASAEAAAPRLALRVVSSVFAEPQRRSDARIHSDAPRAWRGPRKRGLRSPVAPSSKERR
mmetsp:Transcript_21665/g.82448  ORF Transcript_21665/g.82448 Transcript_21665/m.82448 type:complete len:278 (-) Transcript_21665:243-1076(-)